MVHRNKYYLEQTHEASHRQNHSQLDTDSPKVDLVPLTQSKGEDSGKNQAHLPFDLEQSNHYFHLCTRIHLKDHRLDKHRLDLTRNHHLTWTIECRRFDDIPLSGGGTELK